MTKLRTLNELRQVKDTVYNTKKEVKNFYKKVNFDQQYIVDLIKQYPNNQELGKEIRNYFQSLIKEYE